MEVVFSILVLCSVAFAEFEPFKGDLKSFIAISAEDGEDVEISTAEGQSLGSEEIPVDPGIGNWGDNLWRWRTRGDTLVYSQVQVEPRSKEESQCIWHETFPDYRITHIRFLNIGRQRAYVQYIKSSGRSSAKALIRVPPDHQCYLLIEVYAK